MFCERCGARMDDDAVFCEACGHRAGVAEDAAAKGVSVAEDAPPVPVETASPAAPAKPSPAPRRGFPVAGVAVAAVVAVGAAIAGGIALANLTRPAQEEIVTEEPRHDDAADDTGKQEGSGKAEPVDGGTGSDGTGDDGTRPVDGGNMVDEKPVDNPEPEPEPEPVAPAVPDLSNPDDRYALNKFMSNFSESLMYQASRNQMFSEEKRYASAHFDRDNPNYGIMADFLFANNWQNDGTKINGGEEDGYAIFVPWSSVNYMTNLFFDREYDWGDYVRGSQYGEPNGKEDVGLAFYITNGVPSGGPTVVQSVESLGNGLIRIGYDAYIEDSSDYEAYGNYNGLGSPELYGMDIPEINSFLGTSGPTAHGTAVLEAHRDGEGWRFALVSYDLE